MHKPYLLVTLASVLGLVIGAILFVTQPEHAREISMNPLGVLAFGSLGASVGCLIVSGEEGR